MTTTPSYSHVPDINPATGLPMIEDAGIDVGGSPYGVDTHDTGWEPSHVTYDVYSPASIDIDAW
jgi:hypothetical protein